MRTSTQFMSSISAPTSSTSFGFRDLVKGRLMYIVFCPNRYSSDHYVLFCQDPLSHFAIDASPCMKLVRNHCLKYVTVNNQLSFRYLSCIHKNENPVQDDEYNSMIQSRSIS